VKVTFPEIMRGLSRLLEIYPRPRHLPEDLEALAKIWQRELGDLDAAVWNAGISAYCRTDAEYFPKPGPIRKFGEAVTRPSVSVAGLAGAYVEWERTWWEQSLEQPVPCPVCGAIDGWSMKPPTLRRQVYHDAGKHEAAGVPFVGARAQLVGGTAVVPGAAA